ncbi:hypothetical protein ACRWV2_19925, partial [Escherichia coli]
VTLKMPAFEWVHVQLHQQKGMISLSPPTICNSAFFVLWKRDSRTGQTLPDATLAASYPAWSNVLNVGRIRRLRRIRQVTPNLTDDVPASPLSVPQIYYSSQ